MALVGADRERDPKLQVLKLRRDVAVALDCLHEVNKDDLASSTISNKNNT